MRNSKVFQPLNTRARVPPSRMCTNLSQKTLNLDVIHSNAKRKHAAGDFTQPQLVKQTPGKLERQFKLILVTESTTRATATLTKSLYRLKSSLKSVLTRRSNRNLFRITSKIITVSRYHTLRPTELKNALSNSSMAPTKRLIVASQNTAKKFNVQTLGARYSYKSIQQLIDSDAFSFALLQVRWALRTVVLCWVLMELI